MLLSAESKFTAAFCGPGAGSLVPRPHPSAREKGLVTIAGFLVCAH